MSSKTFRISREESVGATGEVRYLHNGHSLPTTAYEITEKCSLKFKIPRSLGTAFADVVITDEKSECEVSVIRAVWSRIEDACDIYLASVPIKQLGAGLYFFHVKLSSVCGTVYGHKDKNNVVFTDKKTGEPFQLTVSSFKHPAPNQYRGGVIYQVFVDRFARGKYTEKKDGNVYLADWDAPLPEYPDYPGAPIKNNYFYGGTLYGVIEKLDYIRSLGVNLIYLSPIFEATSNHKYDTADYMKVDYGFGGDGALQLLIREAMARGIGIILDGVFNHTGADSIYFNKFSRYHTIGAYQSMDSEYFDWYDFKSYPEDYVSWWNIEILPRINPDKEKCREYFVGEKGVISKYAAMGIAGLRLDVVDELSNEFTEAIKDRLAAYSDASILYGEVWEDASNKIAYGKRKEYYLGRQLDGVMNYPLRLGIISYVRDKSTGALEYALCEVMQNMPIRIRDMQMNILGSHDTKRIITALGGVKPDGKKNSELFSLAMTDGEYATAKTRLISAYTVMATLPGIPTIFYGDEAGLQGYSDPFNRRTFPWDNIDSDLLAHYQKIGDIRRRNLIYGNGEFLLMHLSRDLLIFSRYDRKYAYVTAYNNTDSDIELRFSGAATALLCERKSKQFILKGECAEIFKIAKNTKIEF
ncbi:MAG: glycoside hydrolase family 13 protein [Clostridia bacterium]|nr:glycoside hydrolase family 13 protein [Clostridia bacterium]